MDIPKHLDHIKNVKQTKLFQLIVPERIGPFEQNRIKRHHQWEVMFGHFLKKDFPPPLTVFRNQFSRFKLSRLYGQFSGNQFYVWSAT